MSKAASKSFTQFYNGYCREHHLKSKLHLLDNKYLKLNTDRLDKEDWIPIIKALEHFGNDLHSITLYRESLPKLYEQTYSTKKRYDLDHKEPAVLKEPLLKILTEAIIKCINNSKMLCSLSLEAFPTNYLESLVNSICNQTHLQHFSLPYCKLSKEDLILLCTKLSSHTGLQTMNLTGCGITIDGAKRIAALIRSQKLTRYGETWKQSLRYRLPRPDIVPGLRRLTLNNNYSIGDEGFALICYELIDDLWVRAIDFQNCGVTKQSIDITKELITNNQVLRVLDLRKNDIPIKFLETVTSMLNENDKGNDENVYEWLNSTNTRISNISNTNGNRQRVKIPGEIFNASNRKLSESSLNRNQFELKQSYKMTRSLKGLEETQNPCEKWIHRRATSVIGELERTKDILNNVSNKLSEEKNKRKALEKQQQKYQDQLHEIRSCLKQHSKTGQMDSSSIDTESTVVSSKHTASITLKEPNLNHRKTFMMNQNKRKTKGIVKTKSKNANLDTKHSKLIVNKSLQSAKLFLLIPKQSNKNSFHYVKSLDDKNIISKLNNLVL